MAKAATVLKSILIKSKRRGVILANWMNYKKGKILLNVTDVNDSVKEGWKEKVVQTIKVA